jgi:ATP-binding cassette, subfamily B, bacterial PglK
VRKESIKMKTFTRKTLSLLTPREKAKGALVLLVMIAMAMLEVVGVASIMPFLSVASNPNVIETNQLLSRLYHGLGFDSVEGFLTFLAVASITLIVVASVVRTVGHYAINRFSQMRHHSISLRLLETYLRQPYLFYLNRHTGDLAKGILSEVDHVLRYGLKPAMETLAHGLTAVAILALLLFVDPLATLVVAAISVGAYGVLYLAIRGYVGRIGVARRTANRQRFQAASEALGGIKDIKILGRERYFLKRFAKPSRKKSHYHAINATLSAVPRFGIEAVAFGTILLFSLYLITRGGLDGEGGLAQAAPLLGVYAFAGYRLLPAVQHVYQGVTKIRFAEAALDSLHRELAEAKALPGLVDAPPPPLPLNERLEVRGLAFHYPGAEGVGVEDIDFSVRAGQSLGIVGGSGAGKTTLVDLLLGLLTPSRGQILADGVAVTPENIRNWQANLGYVPQAIFLSDATVAENIAFGKPIEDIDMERVRESAELAQLADFIESTPGGYLTEVGERGVRLSGGQRQRIGIARALYHDPQALVFDEATSALDNLTERGVIDAIKTLAGRKTTITVAHRLSTVADCDLILVLEGGRLVDSGTYAELQTSSVAFRRMLLSA